MSTELQSPRAGAGKAPGLAEDQIDAIAKPFIRSLGGDHWHSGEDGIRDNSDLYEFARALLAAAPAAAPADLVPTGPRAEFVLNELRSAINAMLTFFGMDEDEASKPTFDKARQASNYAELVMRPLKPWERQSLEDFRACVHRWHEKAVAKGYDGVEAMCDTAAPAVSAPAGMVLVPKEPTAEEVADVIELEFSETGEWPEGDSEVVRAFLKHWRPVQAPATADGSQP